MIGSEVGAVQLTILAQAASEEVEVSLGRADHTGSI